MSENLPFTVEQQEAIIGHCLNDKSFFIKCKDKLKPGWFSRDITLGTIFNELCKSYDKYGQFIQSIEEFKQEEYFQELTPKEQSQCYNTIDRCDGRTKQFSLKRLERELTGFLRTSMFKESIEESARKYRKDGLDDAYAWTVQKLNDIKQATFVDDKTVLSFANPEIWIRQHEIRQGEAISTGCKLLDKALGGGLFKKETCAILAPANSGKTATLITVARNAIVSEKKVLFLIHEGNPEEIRLRLMGSLLCVPKNWLYEWAKDERSHFISIASTIMERYLRFVPYIRTGAMFVEDVMDLIKKIQSEEIEKTGIGFDIIIDDYPKKLKSKFRAGSREGLYRNELAEIYDNFNHIATELDAHCLVAVQTNRNGAKMNSGSIDSKHFLSIEETDESFGIAQNIGNIVSLNRGQVERKHNIASFSITKSRNSETEVVVHTRTDFLCPVVFADREFIKGPNQKHLKYNFLASYYQEDNKREPIENINNKLVQIEEPEKSIDIDNVQTKEKVEDGQKV